MRFHQALPHFESLWRPILLFRLALVKTQNETPGGEPPRPAAATTYCKRPHTCPTTFRRSGRFRLETAFRYGRRSRGDSTGRHLGLSRTGPQGASTGVQEVAKPGSG